MSDCVSRATPGDTITVIGNATWTSTLALTRGVKLVGSGNPVITGGLTLFYWTPDASAQAAHETLTIQGFTLDGNNATNWGTGIIRAYNGSATDYVNLVVQNNTIRNLKARALYLTGMIYGVASSNTFDRVAMLLGAFGRNATSWANQTQAYGVAQNFYFENNTIQFSSDVAGFPGKGWIESGQGGRMVIRYNTWDFTNVASPDTVWDVHGLQSMVDASGTDRNCGYPGHPPCDPTIRRCEEYSSMVAEFYGNKLSGYPWAQGIGGQRGGWVLFYNNVYTANAGRSWINVAEYACDSCQSTGSHTQRIDNSYSWNNFSNATRLTIAEPSLDYCKTAIGSPYSITANRDFFTDAYSTFDGSAGVGCGTLAARPSTCSTGVGYWATNQSCSDLNAMVGRRPSTPIEGTLYKCAAPNTWTAYYAPYQFPHPLTGPAAPNNVLIKK